MIHYILQTLAFQLLFLVVYDLFLKRETFFSINRIYLLLTPIVSLIIPFVSIPEIKETIPPDYIVQLPAIILEDQSSVQGLTQAFTNGWVSLDTVWMLGAFISLLLLFYKLIKLFKLKFSGKPSKSDAYRVVLLPNSNTAFTFLNTIFLGANISEAQKANILIHESVHVEQRHTLDLLLFEILRILFWFNPLIYVYQKRVSALHEYIADYHVAKQQTKKEYYQELLSQVFNTEKISFINTFFNHSLIKKRIRMLQKSKSKKIVQLKYLLILPVLGAMLMYTSCTQNANAQNEFTSSNVSSQSEILDNIERLKESIAKKGHMTEEEDDALKVLYVLTNPNGLDTDVFQDVKDKVHLPFGVIEKIPVFPGCEGLDNDEAKKCFTQKITKAVFTNFNTKVAKSGVNGKQRIVVKFVIDRNGDVIGVEAKNPHQELRDEAIRVVEMLPKMKPGEQQGKKVGVQYALPILFEIK